MLLAIGNIRRLVLGSHSDRFRSLWNRSLWFRALSFALIVLLHTWTLSAADFEDAQHEFLQGAYQEATELAAAQVDSGIWNERWPRLLIKCQLATGHYAEARESYDAAIKRYPTSLTLRMQGLDILRLNHLPDEAFAAQTQILQLLQSSSSRFASRDNLIAAGRYFTERGEDAKKILNLFYDRVRDADPTFLDAYIATAELALQKGDFKVAADTLQAAERNDITDPQVAYLLARAWQSSDPEKSTAALERALQQNPNHTPSLLFQAEAMIDRERYDLAQEIIQRVLQINLHDQEAWALLAVLAHLRGEYEMEALMRAAALSTWGDNPRVDHLIGLKLSQKYRFEEGAAYQRKALAMDPNYPPASFQLAQDLLRLGDDDIGWQLAETVAKEDQYNVVAHNLVTLHDRIKTFTVIEAGDIHVRMDSQEARIYGQDVLDLLTEAKQSLCTKYQVEPGAPIIVEIFPEQKDFAIRTFGLPGGAGFLGVCFGRVITANSPASQGERPSNWRSVLWHEFCHVVTLEKTKNRMPRWLSEGISVYEERQRDPSWGESMTPRYREMLLGDDLTPVSELSAAFLSPPSPIHLQFAYYESSLVVEFLTERYGLDALKQILVDLGDGLSVNDALVRSVGSLPKLDSQFADYARMRASQFGADADWSRDELPEKVSPDELVAWVTEHPDNYWGLRSLAEAMIATGRISEARQPLEKLRELGTVTGSQGGPLEMLAGVYEKLEEPQAERKTLEQIIQLSSDALPALRRLISMARNDSEWDDVTRYAEKMQSINPLLPESHVAMADAAEHLDQPQKAVRALNAISALDPIDPAGVDFRIARALAAMQQKALAKHHVLRASTKHPDTARRCGCCWRSTTIRPMIRPTRPIRPGGRVRRPMHRPRPGSRTNKPRQSHDQTDRSFPVTTCRRPVHHRSTDAGRRCRRPAGLAGWLSAV